MSDARLSWFKHVWFDTKDRKRHCTRSDNPKGQILSLCGKWFFVDSTDNHTMSRCRTCQRVADVVYVGAKVVSV